MHFLVDARYIDNQPRLRVLNASSGQVLLEWELHQVQQLMDDGEIPEHQFLQPEKYGMKLLVKNLFLLACADEMNKPEIRENKNPWLDYRLFGKC